MDIFKKHCPYCCNPEQADDGSMEMVDHVIGMDDEIYCSRCDGHMSLFEDNESLECLACKPKTKVFLMVDATVLLEFPNMDTAEAWLNEQPDPVVFSTQLGLSAEEVKQGKVGDLAIPKAALHFDMEWNTPDGKCPF